MDQELKNAFAMSTILMFAFAQIWRVFPNAITTDAMIIIVAITMILTVCVFFQIIATVTKGIIWELIKRTRTKLHWSVGIIASLLSGTFTILMTAILSQWIDFGWLWWSTILISVAVIGSAVSWAIFIVHAEIANLKRDKIFII